MYEGSFSFFLFSLFFSFMVYRRYTSLVVDLETDVFLFYAVFVFSVHCFEFTCCTP